MVRWWFEIILWKRILIALALGVVAGALLGEYASAIKWVGDLFVNLIRMIVVPLIFTTLVSGVIAMGNPKKLGSIGLKTMALYMATTAVAIIVGLFLAANLQPGIGVDLGGAVPRDLAEAQPLADRLIGIVPRNPIAALANGDVLSIIFFALLVGSSLLIIGEKGKPLADVIEAGAEVILKITHLVMEIAPFGVFALIADMVGANGLLALADVILLTVAVIGGCLLHIFLVHGFIIRAVLGLPALQFFRGIIDAQLVALSTSSSSATLPVTIAVAEDNLGIKPTVASSVLPLGSTINMDGTAIYVGIVAVFSAQAFGIELTAADYGIIALTTTLVSVGTAAVPSASLFLLAAVLAELGISADQTAIIVGFLFAFDRPLDMMRTVVNVTGDLSVATAVAKWEGELDEAVFRAPNKE